jgi:DNA-binding beta-propeller fold protein YncE
MVQGLEMNGPGGIASDFRHGEVHLYISDARNHRVLAWRDARAFQTGDPPALILGQPSPQSSAPRGIGARGFNTPLGLAVDPANGNLYVVDSIQNRVLRFPSPFDNPSRVEPDKVYGQLNFNNVNAGTSNATLRAPRAVAFDNLRNLWVVDSGNHRLIRFNRDALEALEPEADMVLGQQNFTIGTANRGSGSVSATGFDLPAALTFDGGGNLYVADFNNLRVLRFAAPLGAESAANAVYGQASLTARELPPQASARTIFGPTAVGVDGGNVYVAAPADNRILVFAADGSPGSPAREILGQPDFTLTRPNPGSFPFASATTFASPNDIEIDPDGNLVVSDSGNNRVLSFPRGGKSATRVWGQVDFRANGANRVKPGSINSPYKVVIDYSQSPYALYVSDLNNHRVLGWRDSVRFRTGDPADLVIGQPDFDSAAPNVDSRAMANPTATSLFAPRGLALDVDGNLYVADSGNNRVLRYPRPVTQTGRITPDLVLGQTDFTTAVSAGVSASSMNAPAGLAVDPNGDLFVADSGNHRVLQFPRGSVNGAAAIRVIGQPGFITGVSPSVPSVQTLNAPQGIAVDASSTLFVADAGSNRVLVFPNTRDAATAGAAAAVVLGQNGFDTASPRGGAGGLRIPFDVALDSSGKIYVSDTGNNRVLVYPSLLFLPLTGAEAI